MLDVRVTSKIKSKGLGCKITSAKLMNYATYISYYIIGIRLEFNNNVYHIFSSSVQNLILRIEVFVTDQSRGTKILINSSISRDFRLLIL